MLALVFSCCGLRHRPRVPLDERTPLIPSDDTPTPQPRVIDHQKLKERLCSVVRANERKMVNVNAQFPFNFHNQDNPEQSSSRSSRNVSGGTLAGSRAASRSPHRELHKSPSTTSLRRDHYLPLAVNAAAPILNVRLVKSVPPIQTARGRSHRSGDCNSRTPALGLHPDLSPDDEHTSRALLPATFALEPHLPGSSETLPHHPEDFNIHDAGAVARSWGD